MVIEVVDGLPVRLRAPHDLSWLSELGRVVTVLVENPLQLALSFGAQGCTGICHGRQPSNRWSALAAAFEHRHRHEEGVRPLALPEPSLDGAEGSEGGAVTEERQVPE